MRGWQTKPLEKVTYLAGRIGWKGLTAKEYTDTGPLFLSVHSLNYGDWVDFRDANHITQERYDESPEIMLQANDVLICKDGAGIGKTGIIKSLPELATINSSLLLIRAQKDLLPKFLYYALSSPNFQRIVQERIEGATTPHLYQKDIRQFAISYPPLHEQKRIVAILDEAFEGIDAAIANTQANLAAARELFDSYLNAVFQQKREAWQGTTIGSIAEVYDGPHATPKTVDEGPIFLGITALENGSLKLDKTRHVTKEDFKKWTRRVTPQADDVVFSYETRLGQAAIIPQGIDCCLGRRMGLVRIKSDRMRPKFFLYQYLSKPFQDFLRSKTVQGATVDRIPLKEFPDFPVLVPELNLQDLLISDIEKIADYSSNLENSYQQKLNALHELKQSILAKAFRGELTQEEIAA